MKRRNFILLLVLATGFYLAGCSKNDFLKIPDTDEYVTFQTPNSEFVLATPDSILFSRVNNTNTITARNSSSSINIIISFEAPTSPGQYNASYVEAYAPGSYFVPLTNQTLSINVSEFGGSGQLITGNFLGMMKDSLQDVRTMVVSNFKIRVP